MSDDDGSDMVCCPFSDSDGDRPSCFTKHEPKARKTHICCECGEEISVGDRYEKTSGVWDGRPDTFKTCLPCADVRDHFACNGFVYGEVWSQLRENFFPEMKCGGQCMEGLSPRGKRKLIDERMEWYFAHDEINDSAWEGWEKRRPDAPHA